MVSKKSLLSGSGSQHVIVKSINSFGAPSFARDLFFEEKKRFS